MDPFGDLPPPKHEDEPGVPHKKARAHEAPQPSSASESAQQQQQHVQQRSSVADYLGEREQHEHTLGALRKLAHTLREAKKEAPLRKALQMLAQLMSQPHIEPKHSHDLLAALDASMASRERCSSPGLRAEYIRVFQLALSLRDRVAVKPRDKLRIDAWSIHAVTANELFTDESYEFSRAVQKVKTELEHLSDNATPSANGGHHSSTESGEEAAKQAESPKHESEDARETEDVDRMRQESLMACLRAANAQYKKPWARTTIDLLMQHAHKRKHTFASAEHRDELQRMYDESNRAKNARKRAAPDSERTSFDLGQEKYAKAHVPARKPVGAELGVDGRGETSVEGINTFGKQ